MLAMHQARRCGAKTRNGSPCKAPAVRGKTRCRMHGGSSGSGAPPGNQNAFKTGRFTKTRIAHRKQVRLFLAAAKDLLDDLEVSD